MPRNNVIMIRETCLKTVSRRAAWKRLADFSEMLERKKLQSIRFDQ